MKNIKFIKETKKIEKYEKNSKIKKLRKKVTALSLTAVITALGAGFTTADAASMKLLYIGSWDSEVPQVQQILADKGYFNHEVTGYYGKITAAAVKKFQADLGIRCDGIVGDETRSKLYDSVSYNADDVYWLARIAHAEAQGEGYSGMLAVANCIINRTQSADFPNTVKGVIFDTKYGVQYQPTVNGTIYNTPCDTAVEAAKNALNGHNNVGSSMYFFNPNKATSTWIANNRQYYTTIGNHAFYL